MLNACHIETTDRSLGYMVLQGPAQMTSRRGMRVKCIPFWNIADFPWRRSSSELSALYTLYYKFDFEFQLAESCEDFQTCRRIFQPIFNMNRCLGQPPTIVFIQTHSKCFFRACLLEE
jgi:hypothetical protein